MTMEDKCIQQSKHLEKGNKLFRKAVSLLSKNSVHFWVDAGTLLGLTRDQSLIPWDSDIDLGVWKDSVTEEEIIRIFEEENFVVESLLPEGRPCINCFSQDSACEFYVDIAFYSREDGYALYESYYRDYEHLSIFQKMILFLANRLQSKQSQEKGSGSHKNQLKINAYKAIEALIYQIIPQNLRLSIAKKLMSFLERTLPKFKVVYKYPEHFYDELKQVELLGVAVNVPNDTESFLETAYGQDWRIPKDYGNKWWLGATEVDTSPMM